MELKRKIISTLTEWKNSTNKIALLIAGARQVGKTTTIREFGQSEYKNFVEINFEKTPSAMEAFAGNRDAETIYSNLTMLGYGPFVPGQTLLFLDEIQSCPNARTAIKFLVEDGRIDIIESGSLLGINYKDVSSFPVGFEQEVKMYPLDFEEFLWASGITDDIIGKLRKYYDTNTPVPAFMHEQMMKLFRQFLIVGGMPQAVNSFVTGIDFKKTLTIQRNIMMSYRNDIAKYADREKHLAKMVFDQIPQQLCKQDKRFILADLEKGASQRKYGDATMWLADAGIAYFSFNVSKFELPFSFSEKRNLYKLFLHDTGLLCSTSLDRIQFEVMNGKIDINEGYLTENFVAQELVKKGINPNYYDKKSRQELDFVYQDEGKISVIEVKSGNDYKRHASLDRIIESDSDKINKAIVFSKFNIETIDSVTHLPFYMLMFL